MSNIERHKPRKKIEIKKERCWRERERERDRERERERTDST